MYPLLQEINVKIGDYIKKESISNTEIELKNLMGKFSMDALASCVFGVESGSFSRGNDSEFPLQKSSGIRFQGQDQLTQSQDH